MKNKVKSTTTINSHHSSLNTELYSIVGKRWCDASADNVSNEGSQPGARQNVGVGRIFFVPCWSSWNVKRNTLWLIYNEKIFRKLFIGVVVIATFYFMDQPNKIHLLRSTPWSFVPIVVSLFLIELITHQDLVIIMCIIIQMYDREAERLKVMEKRPLS